MPGSSVRGGGEARVVGRRGHEHRLEVLCAHGPCEEEPLCELVAVLAAQLFELVLELNALGDQVELECRPRSISERTIATASVESWRSETNDRSIFKMSTGILRR